MHPDLDLYGVLRAAYQRDLRTEADKARLLSLAGRSVKQPARRVDQLLPLARFMLLLVPLAQRWGFGFGEVSR